VSTSRVPHTFPPSGMCGRHNVPESTLRLHQSPTYLLIYLPLIRKSRMSGAPGTRPTLKRLAWER
jgi:hypothetical protein